LTPTPSRKPIATVPVLGSILKRTIRLGGAYENRRVSPVRQQRLVLRKLLRKAQLTDFGRTYAFHELIPLPPNQLEAAFAKAVPMHDYNAMYKGWWHRLLNGEQDVTWPGHIRYFALSSGTSESASKHIPITREMIRAIQKGGFKQIFTLAWFNLPPGLLEKGILMLGGSTHLNNHGHYYSGDLSGISTSKLPFWFQHFYKPGQEIASNPDWDTKLHEIVLAAKGWDIWCISGVPAWLQILLEKIIEHYQVDTIHDVWPNLSIYSWGGVSIEPYLAGFNKLLAKPLIYLETYLASEGFIAYAARPDANGMRLITNNGIYFEFVPFDDKNFTPEGEMRPEAVAIPLQHVEEGVSYALLMTTCAGAWRYLIGDVIEFSSKALTEIRIVGRTKHYISLCGEHLSVDNMNHAIAEVSKQLGLTVKEFAVAGEPFENLFAHRWFVGVEGITENTPAAELSALNDKLAAALDAELCRLNDDYCVERSAALRAVFCEALPPERFYGWMQAQGKMGGQNKFPRVLAGDKLKSWKAFLG